MNGLRNFTWLLTTIMILLLTGCDYQEIDSINTLLVMGIDQNEKGEIRVTIETPDYPKSKGKQQKSLTMEGVGKSIEEAEKNIQFRSPKELYFAHTTLLLLGADLAKRDISGILDYFERGRYFRPTIYMAVCQPAANSILSANLNSEALHAFGIRDLINNSTKISRTVTSDMIHIMRGEYSPSKTFGIAALKLSTEEEPEVAGVGLIQNHHMVRWIASKDVPYWILMHERHLYNMNFSVTDTGHQKINGRLIWGRATLTTRWRNGKLTAVYKVRGSGQIDELSHEMQLTPEELTKIERHLNMEFNKKSHKLIQSFQASQIDGLSLADECFRKHRNTYQSLKNNWSEVFSQANIQCEYHIHLIRSGMKK